MCIPNSLLSSQLRPQFTSIVLINEFIEKQQNLFHLLIEKYCLKITTYHVFAKTYYLPAPNSVLSGRPFTSVYVCACVCVLK